MSIEVANTIITNTFQFLINRVNELADSMTNKAVTTDSNTAVGNAAVSNAFTANVLIADTVRVSNTTSNIVIGVPNTSVVANGSYYLNANGSWAPIVFPVSSFTVNTSTTFTQEIDSYFMSQIGGVEYFVRIKDNNANNYQASKVLSFHNGVSAFSTEYGSMISNTTLGVFSVGSNTTHVILYITPTSTNTSINISRVNF